MAGDQFNSISSTLFALCKTICTIHCAFTPQKVYQLFGVDRKVGLRPTFNVNEIEHMSFVCSVFLSLPIYSQHLLVLLFGTFRVIHGNCESAKTGMTAEALGVSVAPSFFQTCVTEGKIARPDEVQKFKVRLVCAIFIFLNGLSIMTSQRSSFCHNKMPVEPRFSSIVSIKSKPPLPSCVTSLMNVPKSSIFK